MLTISPPPGSIMLPKREPNIPLNLISFKQATGFVLWNGLWERNAQFYLMKFQRQDYPKSPVARFFGGTAIPFPHSLRSTGSQSLIRLAEYLGIDLPETAGEGFIPLHHFMKSETTVHEQVDVANAREVKIPVFETHGLLPADEAFINTYRDKLEQVDLLYGPALTDPSIVATENDLPFNDAAMVPILRHLLTQGKKPAGTQSVHSAVNPVWANGDYTPNWDTRVPQFRTSSE